MDDGCVTGLCGVASARETGFYRISVDQSDVHSALCLTCSCSCLALDARSSCGSAVIHVVDVYLYRIVRSFVHVVFLACRSEFPGKSVLAPWRTTSITSMVVLNRID